MTGTPRITRVVIVDDHEMIREMLQRVFATLPNFEIISQATTGLEALSVCVKEKPDLVLLDANLPEFNGLEVLRQLKSKLPQARFLVLSGSEDDALPVRFIQAGAHGYVTKMESLQVLLDAIQAVAGGGNYFQVRQKDLLQRLIQAPARQEVLTSREKQVLQMVAEGFITKEIAAKLQISVKTAETHRTNLMRKLDIHDRANLTRYAISEGLCSLPGLRERPGNN